MHSCTNISQITGATLHLILVHLSPVEVGAILQNLEATHWTKLFRATWHLITLFRKQNALYWLQYRQGISYDSLWYKVL